MKEWATPLAVAAMTGEVVTTARTVSPFGVGRCSKLPVVSGLGSVAAGLCGCGPSIVGPKFQHVNFIDINGDIHELYLSG